MTKSSSAARLEMTGASAGQRVSARYGERQVLAGQRFPRDTLVLGAVRRDLEVVAPGEQGGGGGVVLGVLEVEAHPGMLLPEARDETGHQPGTEGELEAQPHHARLGLDHLRDRRDGVVVVVEHRVDMGLEGTPGAREPEQPAAPGEQLGAHVVLEPGESPRDAGLADHLQLGDLGHRRPVSHLLEPAECGQVHAS